MRAHTCLLVLFFECARLHLHMHMHVHMGGVLVYTCMCRCLWNTCLHVGPCHSVCVHACFFISGCGHVMLCVRMHHTHMHVYFNTHTHTPMHMHAQVRPCTFTNTSQTSTHAHACAHACMRPPLTLICIYIRTHNILQSLVSVKMRYYAARYDDPPCS
jgi:hypothetical protein